MIMICKKPQKKSKVLPVLTFILFQTLSSLFSGSLEGKTVVDIAVGYDHNLALCSDGSVHGWGMNESGELGFKDYNNTNFKEIDEGLTENKSREEETLEEGKKNDHFKIL